MFTVHIVIHDAVKEVQVEHLVCVILFEDQNGIRLTLTILILREYHYMLKSLMKIPKDFLQIVNNLGINVKLEVQNMTRYSILEL